MNFHSKVNASIRAS